MTQVHDVVGQQFVVRARRQIPMPLGVGWRLVEEGKIRNQRIVGQARIARPDPDRAMALSDRERADTGGLGDTPIAVGIVRTLATAIKTQAVVRTLNAVADNLAHVQRGKTVRATIGERLDRPLAIAKEHDGLLDDGSAKHPTLRQLVRPSSDVPGVEQITHDVLLVFLILMTRRMGRSAISVCGHRSGKS
ncbi:hypothetical protein D3C76_1004970 [compost metagenome]